MVMTLTEALTLLQGSLPTPEINGSMMGFNYNLCAEGYDLIPLALTNLCPVFRNDCEVYFFTFAHETPYQYVVKYR